MLDSDQQQEFEAFYKRRVCYECSDALWKSWLPLKIEAEKGSDTYPADKQKLIYNGKVLENDDPLSKYEINEKKFLVVSIFL